MKKSNLVCGIVYTLVGFVFLMMALITDTKLDSILFGLTGATIAPGLLMIYRYFYWSSPKRSQKYQEILENQRIERHDELKEKIRDKSGRYAYVFGLIITSVAILVFCILGNCRKLSHDCSLFRRIFSCSNYLGYNYFQSFIEEI